MAEFICKSPYQAAPTPRYNVCRVRVPQDRLDDELDGGLHPNARFRARDEVEGCPARSQPHQSPEVPLEMVLATGIDSDPREVVELIEREPGHGRLATYTICRLGVPRDRMVDEVEAGLHRGYHTVEMSSGTFVRANPDGAKENNVNPPGRSWACGVVCPIGKGDPTRFV